MDSRRPRISGRSCCPRPQPTARAPRSGAGLPRIRVGQVLRVDRRLVGRDREDDARPLARMSDEPLAAPHRDRRRRSSGSHARRAPPAGTASRRGRPARCRSAVSRRPAGRLLRRRVGLAERQRVAVGCRPPRRARSPASCRTRSATPRCSPARPARAAAGGRRRSASSGRTRPSPGESSARSASRRFSNGSRRARRPPAARPARQKNEQGDDGDDERVASVRTGSRGTG